MLERYSRFEFIVNRTFKIFPVLITSTALVALLVFAAQGLRVAPLSFFASISLTYLFVGVAPVNPVLWSLVSEVIFYGIAACVGRFSPQRLRGLQALFVAATLIALALHNAWTSSVLYRVEIAVHRSASAARSILRRGAQGWRARRSSSPHALAWPSRSCI